MFSFNEDFYFEKNCSLDWVKRKWARIFENI